MTTPDLDARVAEVVLDHDVQIAKLKQSIHWLRERALRTTIEEDELRERERDATLITDLHAALKAARGEEFDFGAEAVIQRIENLYYKRREQTVSFGLMDDVIACIRRLMRAKSPDYDYMQYVVMGPGGEPLRSDIDEEGAWELSAYSLIGKQALRPPPHCKEDMQQLGYTVRRVLCRLAPDDGES